MMIENFLSSIFTENVVAELGGWYHDIYAWSVLAVVCGLCLAGVCLVWCLCRWLVRWR